MNTNFQTLLTSEHNAHILNLFFGAYFAVKNPAIKAAAICDLLGVPKKDRKTVGHANFKAFKKASNMLTRQIAPLAPIAEKAFLASPPPSLEASLDDISAWVEAIFSDFTLSEFIEGYLSAEQKANIEKEKQEKIAAAKALKDLNKDVAPNLAPPKASAAPKGNVSNGTKTPDTATTVGTKVERLIEAAIERVQFDAAKFINEISAKHIGPSFSKAQKVAVAKAMNELAAQLQAAYLEQSKGAEFVPTH